MRMGINSMTKANKVIEAEIWRDIADYGGSYQVSSIGRVRSTDRVIKLSTGNQRHLIGHIIRPHDNGLGYMQVNLMDESHKLHAMLVHKLVLDTFMPLSADESQTLTDIDHIDNGRANNKLSNLRRCTHAENLKSAHRLALIRHACIALDKDGTVIVQASSIREMANLLGVSTGCVQSHLAHGGRTKDGITFKRTDTKQAAKEVA